jgi:hypothetical protein
MLWRRGYGVRGVWLDDAAASGGLQTGEQKQRDESQRVKYA